MGIRYGLKLWSTDDQLVDSARELIDKDLFQYIELTPIPRTEIAPFLLRDIPWVIHATTERYGVNIADKTRAGFNRASLERCFEWSDKLDAEGVVLHPGFGDIADAIGFLDEYSDIRLWIENMPAVGLDGEMMVGSTPEEITKLRQSRFGFCLDLNHAIKAAIRFKKPYPAFIEEFLALKPDLFHLADGGVLVEKDEHLALGDGEYDLKFLKRCVEQSSCERLTFETPRSSKDLIDDIQNLKRFMDL